MKKVELKEKIHYVFHKFFWQILIFIREFIICVLQISRQILIFFNCNENFVFIYCVKEKKIRVIIFFLKRFSNVAFKLKNSNLTEYFIVLCTCLYGMKETLDCLKTQLIHCTSY
jgi:hypothetical protein